MPCPQLFLLRPHDNLLGRLPALELLDALDDLLPADPVHDLVLDGLQRSGGQMGFKRRDPTRNVLGDGGADRLVKPAEVAELGPILLDRGRRVERGPVSCAGD